MSRSVDQARILRDRRPLRPGCIDAIEHRRFRGGEMGSGRRGWRTMMSWRSPLRRFVLLGGAVLWLAGLVVLAQEQSFFAAGPAVGLTAEQASRGKAAYDDNCANCHGTNLDNGQFGPALRGSAFKMRSEERSA